MKPEEAFAALLKRCREDVHCARAVERLFAEYRMEPPAFEWRELAREEVLKNRRQAG